MGDMIDRDAAIGALEDRRDKYHKDTSTWLQIQLDILAIRALPAAPAEDVRVGALREAVEAVNKAREAVIHSGNRAYIDGISVGHARAERAILALIPEAKP